MCYISSHAVEHVQYTNILTWRRDIRVKTAIFFAIAIAKRDLDTKIAPLNMEGLKVSKTFHY